MKRKTSVLLAMATAMCMVTTSCDLFLPWTYQPREFLGVEEFGERTQMPDPYFTWSYYRVLIDRMKDASELTMRQETYVDSREYMEDGEVTKLVVELKTVLYSNYVVESTYTIDGKVADVETISLVEQDGEKKRLEQLKDANGNLVYEQVWDWYEYEEYNYYQYLIESSRFDRYLGSDYYSWSYYKKDDIYSCYATETSPYSNNSVIEEGGPSQYYRESEYLIQFQINDSVDRFEKKYIHDVFYIEKDSEGNIIDPYAYAESITEFTAVYGTRKTYNK